MNGVTHRDRVTAYEAADRDADGRTLLFVHGSGGNHGIWKSQHRMADRFRIVTMDLSGHGESDDVDADPGFECLSAYADDVVSVAEAVDADVVVGNSLGGAVLQHVLLERDLDLDAAVLAGTGAKLAVLSDLLEWLSTDFERAVEFLHGSDRLFHDPDPQYRELSMAAMRECGRAVTERDFRTCHVFDVRDRLGEIATPVLALVGEYDQLTPPTYHDYIAANVQHGEVAVVEDAAHLAMLESAAGFNAAVADFLDRH